MDLAAIAATRNAISEAPAPKRAPDPMEDAARQFEALLVAQILKSAIPSDSSFLGEQDDQAGDHAIQFAMEELGRAIALGGGLGLTQLILQGLRPPDGERTPATTTARTDRESP
jgi:Rod binding domain-containing protein